MRSGGRILFFLEVFRENWGMAITPRTSKVVVGTLIAIGTLVLLRIACRILLCYLDIIIGLVSPGRSWSTEIMNNSASYPGIESLIEITLVPS